MTAPLKSDQATGDLACVMLDIGRRARAAARALSLARSSEKDAALLAMGRAIRARKKDILAANAADVSEAKASGAASAFVDRLLLDETRVAAMADGLAQVRGLNDPIGTVTES
jgi:glutamate-5-semialdehyde dehydrogenase